MAADGQLARRGAYLSPCSPGDPFSVWAAVRGGSAYLPQTSHWYFPQAYQLDLGPLIEYGASPRATLYLTLAAKAHAFLQGRGYVTPQDVKSIGPDVLRHRVIVSYEAEAEEVDADEVVRRVFEGVPVP